MKMLCVRCFIFCGGVGDVWNGEKKKRERKSEEGNMKRGRLGKAKKNQYMSDKKAQILDDSSV